ncbi:conjugal transfer protein TraF [Pukyongiella litopenaei]|uniref:Thioredoxin n=1 Tax=Pukyongiella litopenaei TaxID=2605946 RepID=A0A5C2H1W1_9RHOB|nr:conjugal transfer protein TraF [Pukyongiella litopenaei]QEP30424.1 thioredoxin [Pukyongiella litopenaei]
MKRRAFIAAAAAMAGTGQAVAAPAGSEPGVGVIFVGASWCAFCKSAAPVLAAVTQPAGIAVLVASKDGRPIPPFADVVDAGSHPLAQQITELPTTLIYSQARGGVTGTIRGYRNARHYAQLVAAGLRGAGAG